MIGQANDGRHTCGHGVVALRPSGDLDEVAAFVGKEEGLLLARGEDELLDVSQLLREEKAEGMIEHFVFFVAEEQCAAGVEIEDGAILLLLDAHHHDRLARITPVLEDYPLAEFKLFSDLLQNGVEHGFVVFDCLQIVHIKPINPLAAGYASDEGIALSHLVPHGYALECQFA